MRGKGTRPLYIFLIAGIFSFVCGGRTVHAGELRIWIKEKADVTGDAIALGDIASFVPERDSRVPALRKLEVGSAPAPGRDLVLNSRFLIYRLSSLMGGDHHVRVKVPENLIVHRTGQVVGVKKMTRIFKQYVFSHSPWKRKEMDFESVRVAGPLTLPRGHLSWEVEGRNGGDFVGDVSLVISFFVDGRLYRKVPVSGRILITRRVIRTARRILKGEVIGVKDLLKVTEQTSRIDRNELTRMDQIIGKRAARTLRMGQMITRVMVEVPPAVRKGDRVIIKAENRFIEVTALGRVMEDGRSGDQVRVINVSSGKEIFATVVGPGQVKVSF